MGFAALNPETRSRAGRPSDPRHKYPSQQIGRNSVSVVRHHSSRSRFQPWLMIPKSGSQSRGTIRYAIAPYLL